MAIASLETRQEMGRILAEAASQDPVVEGLWVSADHDGVHLWLVTPPINSDEEDRLYGLMDVLDEQFPDAYFQVHVLNQRYFTGPARNAVPNCAEQVSLRTT